LPAFALSLIVLGHADHVRAQASSLEGVYTSTEQGTEDIERAIDSAVETMNFIKRPIARSRLKKTNPAYQRVEISRSDSQIQVRFDDREPIAMPADGRLTKWTREDGEIFDVSAEWRGTELIQTFKAKDGARVNTFRLSGEGTELALEVEIKSEQLPKPVTYTLSFRRTGM
jgi:hypothetical protein